MENNTAYAFCVIREGEIIFEHQRKMGENNSVFQSELMAISDALDWSESSTYTTIAIYSDSLSSLLALEDINTTNLQIAQIILKLQNTQKLFLFHWIRSHTGIRGNERADTLAKEATLSNTDIPSKFSQFHNLP